MAGDAKELTEKIVKNAEVVAKSIVSDAKEKVKQIMEEADAFSTKYIIESNVAAEDNANETRLRSKTVAELDANKILLNAKKQAINKAFELAKKEIVNKSDSEYTKYIEKIIGNNAEDGDEVVICENDKKRITSEFIKNISDKKKINLSLAKQYGNFVGGVVLTNKGVDKNLCLEMQLRQIREHIEMEVLKLLQI